MKKTLSTLLALIMIALAVIPVAAQAPSPSTAAPGSWTSSINIQNVGGESAEVILRFYDGSGTEVFSDTTSVTGNNAIPAGGSRTLVLSGLSGLPKGQFSVMVESSMPLEVIANSTSSGPITAGAYQGFKQEDLSTDLFLPGLYKAYYGFNSEIVLQNTEATDADVTIDFYNPTTGDPISSARITGVVPKNSTRIFTLSNFNNVPSGNANGILAAKVHSTKLMAGVVNTWSSAMYGEFSDYNGFKSGAKTLYAPGLYKNYYGFVSALTVQNIGSVPTDVLITYTNGVTETTTLKPFQSVAYYQPGNDGLPTGSTGVFSAKIESLPNGSNPAQDIVALVNVENKTKGLLGAYNVPSAPGTAIGCPVLMKEYYGWFTGTTVMNVGADPTDIKITYAGGQTKTFPDVPSNGTVAIVELGPDSPLPNTSAVSATIESLDGQQLVAVVQEDNSRYNTARGDYLLVYTCVTK